MKFLQRKRRKMNNKGMTLVELICGVAILAIISISVASVMIVSANTYSKGSAESEVQQEAQLVANQISDLLIDSTSQVTFEGNKLTIVNSGIKYEIECNSSQELMYKEITIDSLGNPISETEPQLMAEGVESFFVDVDDFVKNGYARLQIKFANSNQSYPANFTITSRNRAASTTSTVLASIVCPSEVILEPYQTYDFDPVVRGLSNTNVNYSISSFTDTANTTFDSFTGEIEIGKNEMANVIHLTITTEEKDEVTNTPLATKYVNIYVRRVNTVDLDGSHASGVAYKAGSKYNLHADIVGTNLYEAVGTDYDANYVNPFNIAWSVSDPTMATITPDPANDANAILTVLQDMPSNGSVTVTAKAQHPDGVNKTGLDYGDAEDTWTLTKPADYFQIGDGWLRQTNQEQASISDLTEILGIISAANPDANIAQRVRFNFREVVGINTYGDYLPVGVEWIWNHPAYSGDADGSRSANLRPAMTGVMEYNKGYLITIQVVAVDQNKSEDDPDYVVQIIDEISEAVEPVSATFDSSLLGFTNSVRNDQASAPTISWSKGDYKTVFSLNSLIGIDRNGNGVTNSMNYIIEKYEGGTWVELANSSTGQNFYDSYKGYVQNQNGSLYMKLGDMNNSYDHTGSYRVKVEISDQPNNYVDIENPAIRAKDPSTIDYVIWDEATGVGIFYFNVTN